MTKVAFITKHLVFTFLYLNGGLKSVVTSQHLGVRPLLNTFVTLSVCIATNLSIILKTDRSSLDYLILINSLITYSLCNFVNLTLLNNQSLLFLK